MRLALMNGDGRSLSVLTAMFERTVYCGHIRGWCDFSCIIFFGPVVNGRDDHSSSYGFFDI